MIMLPDYLDKLNTIKHIHKDSMKEFDIGFSSHNVVDNNYNILWGTPKAWNNSAVLETGFFWEAAHIDTQGIYQHSSFNLEDGWAEVEEFICPKSVSSCEQSKYKQVDKEIFWDGVVLACQNPGDRSIRSVGTPEDFYTFVDRACEFYKERLFIKLHPWNSTKEVLDRLNASASKYGCGIAKCDHSVINSCEFVLVYNSTFSVDCFVRGVPVVQYAPGYFYKTPAVTYTNREFTDIANATLFDGFKLANFLAWRYCFNYSMEPARWANMLKIYENSDKLFPLTEEYSYANNYL